MNKILYAVCIWLLTSTLLSAATINVSNSNELQTAVANANPGDVILLANGAYTAKTINGNGNATNYITIKSENHLGARFTGKLTLKGSFMKLEGIKFTGGGAIYTAAPCTDMILTKLHFDGVTQQHYISLHTNTKRLELSYSLLENKNNNGAMIRFDKTTADTVPSEFYFHHNHFRNFSSQTQGDDETIQFGLGQGAQFKTFNVVEYNLFENLDSEVEVIACKSSDNTIRYNVFKNCFGGLSFRQGHRNKAIGNFFIGDNKPGSRGMLVTGDNHEIINNYFVNIDGPVISLSNGSQEGGVAIGSAPRVRWAKILFNTFVGSDELIWVGFRSDRGPLVPRDCTIANNVFKIPSGMVLKYDLTPVNWTYEGNIAWGGPLGATIPSGVTEIAPNLTNTTVNGYSLQIPNTGSPAINGAAGTYNDVTDDGLGNARSGTKDVGSFEFPATGNPRPPVTASDVGPGTAPPPPPTGGPVYEVENLTYSSGGANTVLGGTGDRINLIADSVGDWVEFTLPNVAAGTYDIEVDIIKFLNAGQAQLTVDGTNQSTIKDWYTNSATTDPFDAGSITFATTGNKTFRFTVTGKNAASTGFKLGFDKITLTAGSGGATPGGTFEAENLSYVGIGGPPNVNPANNAVGMGTNQANSINDIIEFTIPNIAAGTYTLKADIITFGNGGLGQPKYNGANVGAVTDWWNGAGTPDPFTAGTINVGTTGDVVIQFQVTGKSAGSTGYKIMIDKIILE